MCKTALSVVGWSWLFGHLFGFGELAFVLFFFFKVLSNECNLCNFNLIYRFSLHDLIEIKFSHNAFVTIVKF